MKRILMITLTAFFVMLSPDLLQADEISDMKNQIDELKTRLEVLEAEDEDLTHKFSNMVRISGYGDGEFIMTDKKGESNGFRIHHLSLFFTKEISEKWKFFSEIEFEDAPKIGGEDNLGNIENKEGEIFIEAFTLEYYYNHYINFRLGRFLTPGGIWNLEHYPPFVLTQERPLHIRNIFPHLSDGLQFLGSANRHHAVADYILYIANGKGNSGHGDENESKAWGGRLKIKVPILTTAEAGVSYQRDLDNSDTKIKIAGADLRLLWKGLKLQGEYAKGYYDPRGAGIHQRIGYYGQLEYRCGDWTSGYRYDWYDPRTTVDNDRTNIHTLALNYHFTPHVVGKVEYHFVDPQGSMTDNYTKTILSVAVNLGD